MDCTQPRYTDARQSIFYEVGGDHITINHTHIHLSLCDGATEASLQAPNWSNGLLEPTSQFENWSQRYLRVATCYFVNAGTALITAIDLIVQITGLLVHRRDSSNIHPSLVLELKSLHQTLTLIGLAIKEYNNRPLGRSLANTITPEVERSCIILQELLNKISGAWQSLKFTSIGNLWRRVWWSRWDGDEMGSFRQKLCDTRNSLDGFLLALHSYVFLVFQVQPSAETSFILYYHIHKVLHGWSSETNCKRAMYPSNSFMTCLVNVLVMSN
jgi:hypothetical protein